MSEKMVRRFVSRPSRSALRFAYQRNNQGPTTKKVHLAHFSLTKKRRMIRKHGTYLLLIRENKKTLPPSKGQEPLLSRRRKARKKTSLWLAHDTRLTGEEPGKTAAVNTQGSGIWIAS